MTSTIGLFVSQCFKISKYYMYYAVGKKNLVN